MAGRVQNLQSNAFYGTQRALSRLNGITVQVFLASGESDEVADHGHEEAHLLFIAAEGYVSTADGAPEVTSAPSIIFNPAGTAHRDRFIMRGHFISMSLSKVWLGSLCDNAGSPRRPSMRQDCAAVALARPLFALCGRSGPVLPLSVDSICIDILSQFSAEEDKLPRPSWLTRACELLREEASVGSWSVSRVAAEVGVGPIHLARVFRTHLRCSPGEYLQSIRVQRAAGLLCRTRLPVAEIALGAGYADQSHLSRSFRKAWGITPRAYRELVQA